MYRPKDTQERIAHRLKISIGHLRKVLQMIEDDAYCVDIIHQSQAVQKALKEIDHMVLENHLNTCVVETISKGNHKQAIDEIMAVIKKS